MHLCPRFFRAKFLMGRCCEKSSQPEAMIFYVCVGIEYCTCKAVTLRCFSFEYRHKVVSLHLFVVGLKDTSEVRTASTTILFVP